MLKENRKWIAFFVLALILSAVALTLTVVLNKRPLVMSDCSALVKIIYLEDEANYTLAVKNTSNGKLNFLYSGNIQSKSKHYSLSRTISFNYLLASNGELTLMTDSSYPSVIDNVPNELFNKLIYDVSKEKNIFYLSKVEGVIFFDNGHVTIFSCVARNK